MQKTPDPNGSTGESGRSLASFVWPSAALVATGLALFPSSGRDDIYITYWPAHTLAQDGLITNLNGAAVEQSSSLLEVLLLAGMSLVLPLSLPILGWALALAAGIACVVSGEFASRRLGPDYSGAAWLIATATPLVYWSFSGMETSLAALLSLTLVFGWSRYLTQPPLDPDTGAVVKRQGRRLEAGVWLITLCFLAVRPESIFILVCVLAGALLLALRTPEPSQDGFGVKDLPRIARLCGATFLCFAILAGFRSHWFGSLFPQPAAAKSFTRLGGSGLITQLRSGFDYLLSQAGSIFEIGLWLGAATAVFVLVTALRGRRIRVFDGLAGLACTAYIAFVFTTGGDYMEGARYLVPAIPLLCFLASACLHRATPTLTTPLLVILVCVQWLGSVGFARTDSTADPIWARGPAVAEVSAAWTWTETWNRVHRRDAPLIEKLSSFVDRIQAETREPVTLLSKQMGMVPFYLALEHPGRVKFIDAYGLVTRHVTDPGFVEFRDAWRSDRWKVLFENQEFLAGLWGNSRPDLIYDLGTPPADLANHGYVVIHQQSGELWSDSTLFPGGRVSANAWVAVRADLHAAVRGELPGRWRALRKRQPDPSLTAEQRDEIARLEAIGYVSGSTPASERSGVTRFDPARAQPGANFYTSGHEPGATLMDMDGNVLHRWKLDVREAWPDDPERWEHPSAGFWRRARLLDDGDVLAIFEGVGIVKLDRRSKLLWATPNRAHHDLDLLPDGSIVVLTREARVIPRVDPKRPVLEDFVSFLAPDGSPIESLSLLEAFENSEFSDFWNPADQLAGDLFHTNSLEVLDGRLADRVSEFAAGNLLISLLVPNVVAVVDPHARRIVWARKGGAGSFAKQHDPKVLENGNLLLFDNRGLLASSRVLELDPARSDAPVWSFGGGDAEPMQSETCGTAERMANGNTLITESDGGRALEVTPTGEVVWEFYNPNRPSEDPELIATLFELIRLPENFDTGWAHAASAKKFAAARTGTEPAPSRSTPAR